MKTIHKLLAVLLCSFAFSSAYAHNFEVNGIYYKKTSKNTVEVTYMGNSYDEYDEYTGEVVIPETVVYNGVTYSVTSIGDYAFYGCSSLTSATIGNSVTSIGDLAFYSCSSLTSATIGNSVTSIGSGAFYGCSSLTSIEIPNSVTSIGSSAFYNCSSLSSISIPNSVTSIDSSAFSGCSSLTSIEIPNSVTSIGDQAFYGTKSNFKFLSNLPATLGGSSIFPDYAIYVPETAVATYRKEWSDYAHQIFPENIEHQIFDLEANSSLSSLHKAAGEENLGGISELKITGSVNSYDIMIIRNKMTYLRSLDLAEADIVYCPYEYYTGVHSQNDVVSSHFLAPSSKVHALKLPTSATTISDKAFLNCSVLQSVEWSNSLTSIGSSAFSGCKALQSVVFPESLMSIGSSAFYNCRIKRLKFPESLKNIGSSAFKSNSSLESVTFVKDAETVVGSSAFESCSALTEAVFPKNSLASLGTSAFSKCSKLQKANLPMGLSQLPANVFQGCSNLKEIQIPSSIISIADNAFGGVTSTQKVYTYTLEPVDINQNTFACYSTATVYVPRFSYYNYYYNTQWSQFLKLEEFDADWEKNDFYINNDFVLDNDRIDNEPNIDVNDGGGLTVKGDEEQNVGDLEVDGDGASSGGSIIAGDNLTAQKLIINIEITGHKWYFFCFPFDVPLSAVSYEEKGNYVFRYYDGKERANNGIGGWKQVKDDVLAKGTGYIFQCNKSGTLKITLENVTFNDKDIVTELYTWKSESAIHANWSLVGNPYMSYYNIKDIEFNAPITIWDVNTSSYETYNPKDDEYFLFPYQAFFVQKPEGVEGVKFYADKRLTKKQIELMQEGKKLPAQKVEADKNRMLVNLSISDGKMSDRTRVVFNEEMTMQYEMGIDAAKFLSNLANIQLYSHYKGDKYAINERPGAAGDVTLGYVAQSKGVYTLSAQRMDVPMSLYDKVTGTHFDLSVGEYEFTTEAGTYDDRFVLYMGNNANDIESLRNETGVEVVVSEGGILLTGVADHTVNIYTAAGAVAHSAVADGRVELPAGAYVVTVDNKSVKVVVR